MPTITVRDLIAAGLVLAFAVGVGLTAPGAHERAQLDATITVVDAGPERTVGDRPPAIYNATVRIAYHGRRPVTVGVWTWYDRRHSYGYWPANTSRDRGHIRLEPGETTVVDVRATHPENAVLPGIRASFIVMTTDGTRRTATVATMPGRPLADRNRTATPTSTP